MAQFDSTNLLETMYYSLNLLIYVWLINDVRKSTAAIPMKVVEAMKTLAPWRRRDYSLGS